MNRRNVIKAICAAVAMPLQVLGLTRSAAQAAQLPRKGAPYSHAVIFGHLAGDLHYGGTAMVDVQTFYYWPSGTAVLGISYEVEAKLLQPGFKIASGSDVLCASINGKWCVLSCYPCPEAA